MLLQLGAREAGCFRELAVLNTVTILDRFHCIRELAASITEVNCHLHL